MCEGKKIEKKRNDTKILFTFERRTRCKIFDLNIYRCYKHFFLPFPKRCRVVLLLLVKMFVHRISLVLLTRQFILKTFWRTFKQSHSHSEIILSANSNEKEGKKQHPKTIQFDWECYRKWDFSDPRIYIFFSIFESSQLWYRLWFRVILILSIVEFDAMRQIHWVENSYVSFHFDWHWLRRT